MKKPQVIICDDHKALRAGVIKILDENNISILAECEHIEELVRLANSNKNAVLVCDLGIDNLPIIDLVTAIKVVNASCKIVIYTMRENPNTMSICYEAGVMAYVFKRDEIEELVKAIESANEGIRYMPAMVSSILANYHIDQNIPSNILSNKELEIFIAYVNKENPDDFALRNNTSSKHVQNILSKIVKKLGIPRSEFFDYAKKYGLIE